MPASDDATRKQTLRYYPTAQRARRGSMSRCSPCQQQPWSFVTDGRAFELDHPKHRTRRVDQDRAGLPGRDFPGWTNGGDRAWRVVLEAPQRPFLAARRLIKPT